MNSFEKRKRKLIAQRGCAIAMMNDAVVGLAQNAGNPKAVANWKSLFAIGQKRERDIWAQLKDLDC